MFTTLALLGSMLTTAQAAPPVSMGATASTGIGATFDQNPATFRLQIQGEVPIYPDDSVGLGLILPLELTTSGNEGFGFSSTNSMITFVPSARLRIMNAAFIRFYADAGVGLAYVTAHTDGWLIDQSTHRTGWATRTLLGLEIGSPEGGVAVVVEPLGIDTLHFGDRHIAAYVGRLGIGVRY